MLFTLQTPKSPDFSMHDAGVFPWMERKQQKKGATTTGEIRASAMAVWKALKPSKLEKNVDRIRRSATKVVTVELNGKFVQ